MYVAINKSKIQKNISGSIVYAGDSRIIAADQINEALSKGFEVPNYVAPQVVQQSQEALPQELTGLELVEKTLDELSDLVSELTDRQLLVWEEAEKVSETPRKGALDMIEQEMKERDQNQ